MQRVVLILLLVTGLLGAVDLVPDSLVTEPEPGSIKARIRNTISLLDVSDRMKVFLISMLPIFELRGSIPLGIAAFDLPWYDVFWISIVGNMVPIFLLQLILNKIVQFLSRFRLTRPLMDVILRRLRKKSAVIEKYEELGLILFVAIPFPGTGAWTGAFASSLFGLRYWYSMLYILIGVLIAGVVMTVLSLLGWIGAVVAFAALTGALIYRFRPSPRSA